MKIETISYKGWENCFRLTEDDYEVIVNRRCRATHYPFWSC